MFGVWGRPPEKDSRYTSLVHHRNWKKEKDDSSETRKRDRVFSMGSLIASEGALITYLSGTDYWKKKGVSGLAKDVVDPEAWYKKVRSAEHSIPFFNVPLRVTQLGDMLSPFVSSKEMAWTYDKSELFDDKGAVKKDFMSIFLGEEMSSSTSHAREVREKELKSLFERKDFKRVEFQKESGVWGKIVALDQDDKIIAEVTGDRALMERPTTLKGGLPSLFEPMRRQSTFIEPAKDSSWGMKALRFLMGEKAEKHRNLLGFMQGWGGSYIHEHFRAMNTFLKEPVPFFDSLFHLKEKKAESAKNIIDKTIAGSFGEMGRVLRNLVDLEGQQVEQITPLGRLYPWMRPYVSSPYWQATATRLTTALAAKGSIYTMGLPAAYNLIDWTRRKTGELPIGASALVGGASMAVIGAGVGSLIKSDYMAFSNKRIAELAKGAVPRITKTQLAGGVIGLGVGILPGFDKGLTAGFASMYSNARIWSARVWDSLGATESVERQERLMPGITSPAIGFGLAFSGGILGYVNQQMGTTRQLIGYDKHAQQRQAALNKFFGSITQEQFTKAAADANVEDLLMKTLEQGGAVSAELENKVATRATVRSATTDLLLDFAQIEQPGTISQVKEAIDILQHGAMDEAGNARPIRSGSGFIAGILHSWSKSNPDSALTQRLSTETGKKEAASKIHLLWNTIQETWARSQRNYEEELMSPLQKVWSRAKSALTSPSSSFMRGFARGAALFTGASVLGAVAAGPAGGNWNPINLIPGWLIKLTGGGASARETEQIFTGEKEVAIRKARWWSLGSSPWEGSKVSYFRKHRAVVAQTDASDEALYGGFDQKIASDPILNPLRALIDPEFLYERERRLEYVSPTPLSGRLFADVPILGDVMGATVGEILKPTRKIRASEWEGYREPDRFHQMRSAPAVEALGGDAEVTGISQTGVASVMRGTFKKLTEQAGLRGFVLSNLVGFKDRDYASPMVERADSLLSAGRSFWSMNLGDPAGLSESARRYLTRDRNTYFNPLTNLGSEIPWLPKDDFYLDFSRGNYYNKVNEGELRLPGPGFETLHPELKGLHPANYPLAYRYKVLAGTAYGSEEFKFAKQQLIEKMQRNELSDKELEVVAETNRQLEEKSERKPFGREKFSEDNATSRELTVSAVLEDGTFTTLEMGARAIEFGGVNISMAALVREQMKRGNISKIKEAEEKAKIAREQIIQEIKTTLKPGSKVQVTLPQGESAQFQGAKTQAYVKGLSQKLVSLGGELDQEDAIAPKLEFNAAQKGIGRAWEIFRMNADAPLTPGLLLSKILPFKPQEKFIQRLDAVDLYARTRVYGREIQMWQNYKRDFIDSFLGEQKAKVFGDEVPEDVKFRRSLTEYFDKIQWLKNFVHEQAARRIGDGESAAHYKEKKRQTLYGVDPYRGYEDIWRALPQTERDFYREFVGETDPDKQQRILDLVPENMKGILIAQWQNRDMQALRNKQDAGAATQAEKAELRKMQNLRRVEGFTWDETLDREYKSETKGTDISYSDWMRLKVIREYFQAWKMPDASFVGFDPRVDLEEVKYKVAQKEGIDVHDIGMWESVETGMSRKPYLDQAAQEMSGWKGEGMSYQDFELNLRKMIGHANAKIQVTPLPPGARNRMIVRGKDTRESEVRSLLASM